MVIMTHLTLLTPDELLPEEFLKLSFRNRHPAVNEVAHQLRNEITACIEELLATFLDIPYQITVPTPT